MRCCLIKTAALVAVFLCVTSQTRDAAATDKLTILKDGLHWPHVSSLIGYRGRLWFELSGAARKMEAHEEGYYAALAERATPAEGAVAAIVVTRILSLSRPPTTCTTYGS